MGPCLADAPPWVPGLRSALVWAAQTPDFRAFSPLIDIDSVGGRGKGGSQAPEMGAS